MDLFAISRLECTYFYQENKIIVQQMSTTAKYNQRVYRNTVLKNNRKIFDIPIILSSQ